MFIDKATITVMSGKGGDGAISWRREKYEPSGGPDGGDGGIGGSVIFEADPRMTTLTDYKFHGIYKAEAGQDGRKKKMFGKKGEDLILKVPVGTVIREAKSQLPVADLREAGQRFTAVIGGYGGKGNVHFKSSIRRAPRFAKPGGPGQKLELSLEVKLIADVGLVGFPNVGKSTILSVLSNARPKIANYHFTTLDPNLGVVDVGEGHGYVLADIPGLIEGASEGAGLGHEFLKHIERTRLLCHVVDMSGSEGRDPISDFETIQAELAKYHQELEKRVKLVVANKMDLPGAEENLTQFLSYLREKGLLKEETQESWRESEPGLTVLTASAATTEGLQQVKYKLWEFVSHAQNANHEFLEEELVDVNRFFQKDTRIRVTRQGHRIIAQGDPLETLTKKLLMDDEDSITFFENSLEKMGVLDRIRELDPTEDDVIDVEGFEFDWM